MPFRENAIVRHALCPDWGAGRVLQRTDQYLQIDFSAAGLKKLSTSIADQHLVAAQADEFKSRTKSRTAVSAAAKRPRKAR
jgi:hypothetical protein